MKKIILVLVIIEMGIILFQLVSIYTKHSVLGKSVSVNPLSKENLILNSESTLKYFYEPEPNTQNVLSLDYLNYKPSYTAIYTINNDGFNNKENYSVEKPKDTYRIVALGDSFTFGVNVSTEDNYPSQLENLLNQNLRCNNIKKFEVLNLGVGGYDFEYTVERFKLRGQKYNPDLVIWFVVEDDMFRINEKILPKKDYYKERFKKTGEDVELIRQGHFYPEYKIAHDDVVAELGEENILKLQEKSLTKLNYFYRNSLLVFTIKPFKQTHQEILQRFTNSSNKGWFYASSINIYNESDAALPDGHPTKKGHLLIANDLLKYLKENNMIPCK